MGQFTCVLHQPHANYLINNRGQLTGKTFTRKATWGEGYGRAKMRLGAVPAALISVRFFSDSDQGKLKCVIIE